MSRATAHALLVRLHRDLSELRDSPYPGVSVFTNDANMRQLCLVLTPPSGPWQDLSLHFDVELPDDWPASPPQVKNSVGGISHPNLFGNYICCDLLRVPHGHETEYTGGYTPALTLRGLFLQFLTFFSSKVEQEYGGVVHFGDAFVAHYVSEADAITRMSHLTHSHDPYACACSGKQVQALLEDLWVADHSPEIVLTANQKVVQKTKEAMLRSRNPDERVRKFEYRNQEWIQTLACISKWRCTSCPYGSEAAPHCDQRKITVPDIPSESPLLVPPPMCLLPLLCDDIIHMLTSYLPSESVLSFSAAYPRMDAIVKGTHVLLQRELQCFFLRTPLQESVLGIGIAFDEGSRVLSSDFDWLSEAAFIHYNVRNSIQKRGFQFFLPLAFSSAHFERIQSRLWDRLAGIERAVRTAQAKSRPMKPPPLQNHETVSVIYKMMNNIVVALMQSCDSVMDVRRDSGSGVTLLLASEKGVISYCHLFHLLVCLCRTSPMILRDATVRLRRFVDVPASRTKQEVPDIGELIILITLVSALCPNGVTPITWKSHLNGPVLQEVLVRNVRWVLQSAPELEFLEPGASDYRLATTFQYSKTSLRLVMFQITFLRTFVESYASDIARLDDNYGFPDRSIPERMVEEIKSLYKVSSWPAFFSCVQFDRGRAFGKEKFSELLKQAVRTSGERGYHNSSRGRGSLARGRAVAHRRK